ncbi:hypothetical protein D3C84_1005140 [compost metagenome]
MQRLVQLPVEGLQLAVQGITAFGLAKMIVVQLHGQVPAVHRQLPGLAQLLVLAERAPQLRLPVTVQALAIQFVQALVIGRVHV